MPDEHPTACVHRSRDVKCKNRPDEQYTDLVITRILAAKHKPIRGHSYTATKLPALLKQQLQEPRHNKSTGNDIRASQAREAWMIKGFQQHNLSKKDLKQVVQNHAKVGQVPIGYLYPELHQVKGIPNELKKVLLRKEMHRRGYLY